MLQEKDVLVYTIPSCPYCEAAKQLLRSKGIPFTEIKVSTPEERVALVEKAQGRKTVPQIFIKGRSIGGYDDVKALENQGGLSQEM